MRFHEIELLNIPEQGIFLIQGVNESGKSTIGHLVFFALSGEHQNSHSFENLIHWEASQCNIHAKFGHQNKILEIDRQLNRDGSHFSKLTVNGELIAQGNKAILEHLQTIINYTPVHLDHSFLISHKVIQNLLHSDASKHIEYMTGMDQIQNLAHTSKLKHEELLTQIKEANQSLQNLERERNEIQYSESKKNDQEDQKKHFQEEIAKITSTSEQFQKELTIFQNHLQIIDRECKGIPNKLNEDEIDKLESSLKTSKQKLGELQLPEKTQEDLNTALDQIEKLLAYFDAHKNLSSSFESELSNLRTKIGIDEEQADPDSFAQKELQSLRTIAVTRRNFKFWFSSSIFIMLAIVGITFAYIQREQIQTSLMDSFIHEFFTKGHGKSTFQWIKMSFHPNSLGWPNHQNAFICAAIIGFMQFITLILTLKSVTKAKEAKKKHNEILDQKEKLKKEYHNILAADLNDMPEVANVITNCHLTSLKETFQTFNEEHEFLVSHDYNITKIIQLIKRCIENCSQTLGLEIHQLQINIQKEDESKASLEEEMQKLLNQLETTYQQENQHQSVSRKIESLSQEINIKKKDLARSQYLQELSEGTLSTFLDRFKLNLTHLYKKLLPLVTSDRYRSIKIVDGFKLNVFSEERNDFVPLAQLSSGTNDLFILLLQIVLAHCFLEARSISKHFIFLDEPLLAVDPVRYEKLVKLLPNLTTKIDQVFLCRPPENINGYHTIQTSLEQTILKVDFSNPK